MDTIVRYGRLYGVLRLLGLTGLLSACSLGAAINHSVFDYYQVNDLASNQIILLNLLYAKDGAPLHFSELSQIRGQLSVNYSASTTFPFGLNYHTTVDPRNLATLGIGVSTSPSFDISSLDTQNFTRGVMTPITPQEVAFFLNEGIDYRMVLMLLVSGIQPAGTPEQVLNAPNSARMVCVGTPHTMGSNAPLTAYRIIGTNESCEQTHQFLEFYAFLDVLNHTHRLYPVTVRKPPRPIGPPFNLSMNTNLRAIANLDPTKYVLRRLSSGQYQMMTVEHESMVVLCAEDQPSAHVVSVLTSANGSRTRVPQNACTVPQAADDDDAAATAPQPMVTIGETPGTFTLQLRSPLEIIQYVGQILAFQESQTAQNPQKPERCVTLQYIPYDNVNITCSGAVLFHLQNTTAAIAPNDLNVTYDGQRWSLPTPHPCSNSEQCDYSLRTMSIISLLLNRNKSAKDIASTPAVEVVP